jgi:hypothetical protein
MEQLTAIRPVQMDSIKMPQALHASSVLLHAQPVLEIQQIVLSAASLKSAKTYIYMEPNV